MNDPKVTVLMSAYNGARYLRDAIESILGQTFTNFEFLIINDCSTDRSGEILRGFRDPRIRIINNEKNIGLTRSLNRGLTQARGQYIARLDADDISHPERLAKQVRHLDAYPEVGLLATAWETIDEGENWLGISGKGLHSEAIYYTLTFCNFTVGPDVMYRRDLVMDLGGYDEAVRFAQDYDLWTRISRLAKVDHLPETLIKKRCRPDNISSRLKAEQTEYSNRSFKSNLATLMDDARYKADEVMPIRVFHREQRYTKFTYRTLRELVKIESALIAKCPRSLDKAVLKEHVDNRLMSYLWAMLIHRQIRDVARASCTPRFVGAFVNVMTKKLKQHL